MAYAIQTPSLGYPPIAEFIAATGDYITPPPYGTIVTAVDPTYGSGEFIFLKGLDTTGVGTWVTYNLDDGSTALLAANAIGPVAVAMSACVTGKAGWYQISGKAVGKVLASYADNGLVFATATAGSVDDAVVDGDMVHLAKGASAIGTPSAGLAEFEISRPYTDDITTND